jgi:hypothetical protein
LSSNPKEENPEKRLGGENEVLKSIEVGVEWWGERVDFKRTRSKD